MPVNPKPKSQFIIYPSPNSPASKFLTTNKKPLVHKEAVQVKHEASSQQAKIPHKPPVPQPTNSETPVKVTPTMVLESVELLHCKLKSLQDQLASFNNELVHVRHQQEALTQLVDAATPKKPVKPAAESTHGDMLDIKDVAQVLGISKSTIHAMRKKGKFPPPKSISPRCVRWERRTVTAWQESLKDANSLATIASGEVTTD